MERPPTPPVSITSVQRGRSADVHSREVRYLISMGIRTICFVLAVVVSGWLRWVFVAAAIFLPYIAVILANAAGRAHDPQAEPYVPDALGQIEPKDTPDR